MTFDNQVKKAHELARAALKNSYAPYSKLHVAAALKLARSEEIICGVNVENASYGATICAERSALVAAQSKQASPISPEFIVVISDIKGSPITPCGMCLQVLQEFAATDFDVYLGNEKEVTKKLKMSELLPHAFDGKMLPPIA